jgi:hypothetical protein
MAKLDDSSETMTVLVAEEHEDSRDYVLHVIQSMGYRSKPFTPKELARNRSIRRRGSTSAGYPRGPSSESRSDRDAGLDVVGGPRRPLARGDGSGTNAQRRRLRRGLSERRGDEDPDHDERAQDERVAER